MEDRVGSEAGGQPWHRSTFPGRRHLGEPGRGRVGAGCACRVSESFLPGPGSTLRCPAVTHGYVHVPWGALRVSLS